MDWSQVNFFQESEFKCSATGKVKMRPEFILLLDDIRSQLGLPMIVSSGYRDPSHPAELDKLQPGEHTYGCAADILIWGEDAIDLLNIALNKNVSRIGVSQKGAHPSRFIHLGIGDWFYPRFASGIWSY